MVEAIQRRDDIERQIRQRQCLISLERFTITFWDVIIENELVWSEHMSIMCNEIERVYKLVFERRHKEHDLIIYRPERVRQQYVLLWQLAGHSQTCRQSGFLLQVFRTMQL
jgi:hypothetical protein